MGAAKVSWHLVCLVVLSLIIPGAMLPGAAAPGDGVQPADDVPPAPTASDYPFRTIYPTLAQYYAWYDTLVSEYPGLVTKTDIGNSYEGRDIWALTLTSDDDSVVADKPGVLITGDMHAREWSGPQAASYFMWFMLYNYDTNDTIHWLLNNRRIYVVPMCNPDGYYYDGDGGAVPGLSWRKNRNESTPTTAIGVDLNRNWDIDWESGVTDPAALDYHGEAPFSERETQALRNFILANDIDSFQDIHSAAGTLLIPWCYTTAASTHDAWYRATAARMTSLTNMLGAAGTYTYGQAEEILGYSAPGGSIDWTYDALGIQSYCFELYTGGVGFYPGTSSIMAINTDVDDALVYQARIADADIGDGTLDLFPPVPYVVYGHVYGATAPVANTLVTITNEATSESLTIMTDSNGYYELDFTRFASYTTSQTFNIAATTYSLDFTIGTEWGRKIELKMPGAPTGLSVEHWGYETFTETRYMRGVASEAVVNGLTTYSLGTAQSATLVNGASVGNNANIYAGIRVYVRSSAGVETQLTAAVSAVAGRTTVGSGMVSASWTPPATAISTTDSLVIRIYQGTTSTPATLTATWTTGQLGADRLDASTWTVSYWLTRGGTGQASRVIWGTTTYNTRVDGVAYTLPGNPLDHNTLNWTHSGVNVSHFNVYRSTAGIGPWTLIGSSPVGTDTYLDLDRGQADTTYWWYLVRAVSSSGLEESNTNAVQEPGGGAPYAIGLAGRAANSWVFISFPSGLTGNIQTLLTDLGTGGDGLTTWDVAKWYNPQTPSDPWKTFRTAGTGNDMPAVSNAMGFWLHLTANGGDQQLTLSSYAATPASTVITLYAGWNLVGYPSLTDRSGSTTPAAVTIISVYSASAAYTDYVAKASATLHHGNAYFMYATAGTTWTITNP